MFTKFFIALTLISLFGFGFSSQSQAELYRKKISIPIGPSEDLLKESSSLRLQSEPTVQHYNPPSNSFVTILGGIAQPSGLTVNSNGRSVGYNFNNQLPLLSAQFSNYPWSIKYGRLGWAGSIGYSYSEYGGAQKTALHLLPAQLMAAYRAELRSTQSIIPYVMAGPSLWTYFQRGNDEYNTSQSEFAAAGTIGVSFNLNRMGLFNSRTDTELVLQYQRQVSLNSSNDADWGGNVIQIGGTIAL